MAGLDLTDPQVYGHWVTEHVRFSDTDAMGHVNNVAIAAYIESGRVAHGFDLLRDLRTDDGMVILRRAAIDYLDELHYPGAVRVGTTLLRVGTTSYTTGSGVFEGDRCVATAESVLVHADADGARAIDGDLRRRLEAVLAQQT